MRRINKLRKGARGPAAAGALGVEEDNAFGEIKRSAFSDAEQIGISKDFVALWKKSQTRHPNCEDKTANNSDIERSLNGSSGDEKLRCLFRPKTDH